MKKLQAIFLSLLCLFVLTACGNKEKTKENTDSDNKVNEVAGNEAKTDDEEFKKTDISKLDKKQFILKNNKELAEINSDDQGFKSTTIAYLTTDSYEDVKAYFTGVADDLNLQNRTEIKSDEDKTWILGGDYETAQVQFTIIGENDEVTVLVILSE